MLRPTLSTSFLVEDAHAPSEDVQQVQRDADQLDRIWNCNWTQYQLAHYCGVSFDGGLTIQRCHECDEAVVEDSQAAMETFMKHTVLGLKKAYPGRWQSEQKATKRIGLGTNCCNTLGQCFHGSIGTIKQLEEAYKITHSDQAVDSFRLTSAVRLGDSDTFLRDPLTPPRMLASSAQSIAIDKVFPRCYLLRSVQFSELKKDVKTSSGSSASRSFLFIR